MASKHPLTDHEVVLAARQTLRDEGLLPPTTADEVAELEERLGVYLRPTIDPALALRIAKGEAPLPAVSPPTAPPAPATLISEELGMAARGSCEIPPEIREKMRQDRARARNGRHLPG